ncbi:nucleolin-like isoform X2 [Cololabis saira]|uniref:nucleolin-like isoform X2 n=1 Tax=Cololabis saira TaxID=129043 RepID=UPI002AD46C36|nr:nucleolin-like isoform X2 [Cololabis saira]
MAKADIVRCRKRQSIVVGEDPVNNERTGNERIPLTGEVTEVEMKRDDEGDEQDVQIHTAIEVKGKTPTVTVTWGKERDEEENDETEEMSCEGDQVMGNGTGKRKADSCAETSPPKKTKLIDDGLCIYIGNLNNSKTSEEVKVSLAKYLMSQSLLFQDIRLDRSRKYAFVDMASQMDVTKALTLDGETVLEKPMKIAKANAKKEEKVKVKASPLDKTAKDARCLFLKNVPYNATKEDILEVFGKAVAVRFPGGAKGPSQGIAFVEFKDEAIPQKIREENEEVKIQGRVLIVDGVGEDNKNKSEKAEAPPNETLFVGNLPLNVKEKHLKKVFQKAVNIILPQSQGKPRRYAFVEFATVADAEKALQSAQNTKLCKKAIRIQFCNTKTKPQDPKVPSKTLRVSGLTEKTTAEMLKGFFEGALSARVPVTKETGLSQRFGFVDFESEESCKAAKEAMEDCEIDGSKVTVAYATPKGERGQKAVKKPQAGSSPDVATGTQA